MSDSVIIQLLIDFLFELSTYKVFTIELIIYLFIIFVEKILVGENKLFIRRGFPKDRVRNLNISLHQQKL